MRTICSDWEGSLQLNAAFSDTLLEEPPEPTVNKTKRPRGTRNLHRRVQNYTPSAKPATVGAGACWGSRAPRSPPYSVLT